MTMLDHLPTPRRASQFDRTAITRVLTDAFTDDPVVGWLVPDRAERRHRSDALFDAFVDVFAPHDETHVVTTGGIVAGVAMWAPPGSPPVHPDDEDAFNDRIGEIAGPHMERFDILLELFAEVHPEEPSWYLQFLGVDPVVQGKGLGSTALRAVLARADAAGQPAYLEATSTRNRALYERHGFRSIADIVLPGGPTAYAMWREPIVDQNL